MISSINNAYNTQLESRIFGSLEQFIEINLGPPKFLFVYSINVMFVIIDILDM